MRILPFQQLSLRGLSSQAAMDGLPETETRLDQYLSGEIRYFPSGREAIAAVIRHLRLERSDEVFITTTTDTSFVSTCVSATIFNYSKISRVITDKTRAIFVIHSFGFPHPDTPALRAEADSRAIPLIEDCAFAMDACLNDGRLTGSLADYAIYSLPKIFPVATGGLLTSKESFIGGDHIPASIDDWVRRLPALTDRRRRNYKYLDDRIPDAIYGPVKGAVPFMFGFKCSAKGSLSKLTDVEWGITHVPGEVHVPVNPFIEVEEYDQLVRCFR